MRGVPLILALIITAALLAGCGSGSDDSSATTAAETTPPAKPKGPPREMSVTLDGYSGPENLGILMADWEDYFEEIGLEMTVLSPNEPDRVVEYTAGGNVEIGISRMPELVLAQSKGVPVVGIGALVAEPTASMIWLEKSQIKDISALKGKTISTAGLPVQEELLKAVLADAGLSMDDVKLKNSAYNMVPALAKGKVDAIFGASWNLEGIQLEELGLDPVVTKVQDLGIPDYAEYVVIARRDSLKKDPQLFRDFMAAVARGTATSIEDPDLAFEAVNEDVESDYRVTPDVRKVQVEETVPLLSESGEMDPAQAEALVDWMRSEGMIPKKIPVSALLTNEFLPQPGE
ncbi:MAG TPA: ABC transporter substrate-binding protein [Solirubrobacterales bacterium]|nr:ABC transporter substrate-binding protein [Solirubrobacterales bacterium]